MNAHMTMAYVPNLMYNIIQNCSTRLWYNSYITYGQAGKIVYLLNNNE